MALFFALYPLLARWLFGSMLLPWREWASLLLQQGGFFFLAGCLMNLLAWTTFQGDEREWQRKHAVPQA